MIAMSLLLGAQSAWWSIVTVVVTFAASAAYLIRGILDTRRERATASVDA